MERGKAIEDVPDVVLSTPLNIVDPVKLKKTATTSSLRQLLAWSRSKGRNENSNRVNVRKMKEVARGQGTYVAKCTGTARVRRDARVASGSPEFKYLESKIKELMDLQTSMRARVDHALAIYSAKLHKQAKGLYGVISETRHNQSVLQHVSSDLGGEVKALSANVSDASKLMNLLVNDLWVSFWGHGDDHEPMI